MLEDFVFHSTVFLIAGTLVELFASLLITIPLRKVFLTKIMRQFYNDMLSMMTTIKNIKSDGSTEDPEILEWQIFSVIDDLDKQQKQDNNYKNFYLKAGIISLVVGAIYIVLGILIQNHPSMFVF